jgi:hypothetical protein
VLRQPLTGCPPGMIHHEGTKHTKDTKKDTQALLLFFVSFVPSW